MARMFAVIQTGGKQYLVAPGQNIKVEKLPHQKGEEVVFDQILLAEKDSKTEIGTPFVEGARVKATVLKQGRGPKLVVFRFKKKKREKKKKGHRQPFTQVEIKAIEL